jgi:anthranilate phosphoribosyltransferase
MNAAAAIFVGGKAETLSKAAKIAAKVWKAARLWKNCKV